MQGFIFFIIYMEFSAYILTRQVVNIFEWVVAWRGHKRQLRRQLRKAKTYGEWITIAKELDRYMGFDDWKENEDDGYFDYTLVRELEQQSRDLLISIGQEGQADLDENEECQGYKRIDGHSGCMREEQLCRHRIGQDVQRGR